MKQTKGVVGTQNNAEKEIISMSTWARTTRATEKQIELATAWLSRLDVVKKQKT